MSKRILTDSVTAFPRKVLRRLLRPIHTVLDRLESQKDDLYRRSEGQGAHLEGLTGEHHALLARFESRVVQIESLSRSVAGINERLDDLEEKLSAFQALHWDHVALTRRLAAIEDVLAASGPEARRTIEEGAVRPLLPFPGLADSA